MPPAPQLVVVAPRRESAEIRDIRVGATQLMGDAGTPVKVFRTELLNLPDDDWRGNEDFLRPRDAHELYGLLHRRRCLVLALTAAFVRADPSQTPPRRRRAITVEQFVAHKAAVKLVRGAADAQSAIEAFERWPGADECVDEADPRILPMHSFSHLAVYPPLNTSAFRDAFKRTYGGAARRQDTESRTWARADRAAFHGGEALTVALAGLQAGFHWDVTTTTRKKSRLLCANEVWRLGRGHINVYPDGYVRSRSDAKKVWPK